MTARCRNVLTVIGLLALVLPNNEALLRAAQPRVTRITTDGHFKQRPCWSPDGRQLLFARHEGNSIFLFLRDVQSGKEERLTKSATPEFDGVFSPDGKDILLSTDTISPGQGNIDISRLALSDRAAKAVATVGKLSHEEWASWSPDGQRFVFSSTRDDNQELYIADFKAGEWKRLTDDPGTDTHPAWSPDGRTIAFATSRWGDLEIALINPDGSDLRRLTSSKGLDDYPAWSPDGRRLAFTSNRDGNLEIYLQLVDPSAPAQNLTLNSGIDNFPSWTPDGRVGFVSNRDEEFDLYIALPD